MGCQGSGRVRIYLFARDVFLDAEHISYRTSQLSERVVSAQTESEASRVHYAHIKCSFLKVDILSGLQTHVRSCMIISSASIYAYAKLLFCIICGED